MEFKYRQKSDHKEFRSKLGDALWDKRLWAAPDNLVFLRTYDEIEGDCI